MRVISLLIQYSIVAVVLLVISAIIGREILLFWTGIQVKSAVTLMEQIQRGASVSNEKNAKYNQECQLKGGKESEIGFVQIRFLDNKTYHVEVVCSYYAHDPILVKTLALPPFVEKYPGSSGLILRKEVWSSFSVNVYGRKMSFLVKDASYNQKQGVVTDVMNEAPLSICEGYGFQCCDPVTRVGEGDDIPAAIDCPQTCFSHCKPRPTILRLTSDPNPDIQLRQVKVPSGTPIAFYFVVDPGNAATYTVELELGDGHIEQFSETEGTYTHEYQCAESSCEYSVRVKVKDDQGLESVDTSGTMIKVIVN